jgi:hypothetical protein
MFFSQTYSDMSLMRTVRSHIVENMHERENEIIAKSQVVASNVERRIM